MLTPGALVKDPMLERTPPLLIPRPRTIAARARPDQSKVVDRETLRQIETWSGLSFQNVRHIPGSSRGDNIVAETPQGLRLIKRYKNTVSAAMIEHEHSILRRLEAVDHPSPRLVVAPDNSTFEQVAGRSFAVFVYETGYFHYHEYVWSPRRFRDFVSLSGRALGALHRALDGFTPTGANPNGFVSMGGDRERSTAWHHKRLRFASHTAARLTGDGSDELRRILRESASLLEDRLIRLDSELTMADPLRNVIHGDYGPYNVMFKSGHPVFVLDFEMARIDWRITDVAKSFQQFGLTRRGARFKRMATLLSGYRDEVPLSSEEIGLIPTVWEFLSVRRAIVCLSEFCTDRRGDRLTEARQKLGLAALIRSSPNDFRRLTVETR